MEVSATFTQIGVGKMKKKVITKAGSERCQHLDVSLLSTLQKKKENRDFGFVLCFFSIFGIHWSN